MEHMIFKGTATRSAREIAETIDAVGGQLDAFTSAEQTCFYCQVLDGDVGVAVDLLSDIVRRSTFDAKEIDRERQVVLEEIKMVEDDPEESANEAAMASLWGDHPVGRPILGTPETIARFGRDDFVDFFHRHYDGAGIAFVASGALEHEKLERLVTEAFADLPRSGEALPRTVPMFRPGVTRVPRDTQQAHLVLGFPGIPYAHEDRYALFALNNILGGTMSSRLFQEVREKRGLAYNVYSTPILCEDSGALVVYAAVSPESVEATLEVVSAELATLAATPPSEAELEKARGNMKGTTALGMEKTSTRMMTLARQELYYHQHFTLEEVLAAIDAVTTEDVVRVAASILVPGGGNLTALGPVPDGAIGGAGRWLPAGV
jgi:predicted Zn-dependent peptidase